MSHFLFRRFGVPLRNPAKIYTHQQRESDRSSSPYVPKPVDAADLKRGTRPVDASLRRMVKVRDPEKSKGVTDPRDEERTRDLGRSSRN